MTIKPEMQTLNLGQRMTPDNRSTQEVGDPESAYLARGIQPNNVAADVKVDRNGGQGMHVTSDVAAPSHTTNPTDELVVPCARFESRERTAPEARIEMKREGENTVRIQLAPLSERLPYDRPAMNEEKNLVCRQCGADSCDRAYINSAGICRECERTNEAERRVDEINRQQAVRAPVRITNLFPDRGPVYKATEEAGVIREQEEDSALRAKFQELHDGEARAIHTRPEDPVEDSLARSTPPEFVLNGPKPESYIPTSNP